MKKHFVLAIGLALAGLSAPAMAEGQGFVRFEAGSSDVEFEFDGFRGSDEDTAYGVRGGYWFNPNVAIEGFYTRYYSQRYDDGFESASLKLHAVGVGVVGKKNFGGDQQGFYISGRGGFARGVATVDVDGSVEEADAGDVKPYVGVGVGYDFSPGFGLGLNYDQVKGGDEGLDVTARTLTLGLELRF